MRPNKAKNKMNIFLTMRIKYETGGLPLSVFEVCVFNKSVLNTLEHDHQVLVLMKHGAQVRHAAR